MYWLLDRNKTGDESLIAESKSRDKLIKQGQKLVEENHGSVQVVPIVDGVPSEQAVYEAFWKEHYGLIETYYE